MFAAPISPALPDRYNYPGARRARPGAPRISALDGLRGIAIAGVVAFHVGILPGGFLGVDLFFVLSGYLITSILLREHAASGTVSLRQFWTRRARRLVPAVVVLLVAAQLWARTRAAPGELPVLNGQSVAAVLYASNWFNILFDVGYWSTGPANSPLNHLWSLAIEEQFYLAFPLLLLALLKFAGISTKSFAWSCVVLALVSFALTPILFTLFGANRAYFGTDTRAGAILVGAALGAFAFDSVALGRRVIGRGELGGSASGNGALGSSALGGSALGGSPLGGVPFGSGATLPTSSANRGALIAGIIAVPSMLVVVALWASISTVSTALYRGGLALHGLCSVAIIAAVILNPHAAYARVLQWRPLVWLGERSYSLYLWHWPLLVVLTPAVTGLHGIAQFVLVTIAIAICTIVSYEIVEYPIRYSQLRGARLATTLAVPACFVVASALWWQPAPPPQFGANTLVTLGNGGIRLMITGDSWARNLGIALAKVDSTHTMSILNLGKGGCGIADAKRERSIDKGEFETPFDCLLWPETWRSTVARVRPEVAILGVGTWDLAPQDFDGTGEFVGACHPQFAQRYSQQLDRAIAVLGANGARIFVLTIRDNDGRAGSAPDCMNVLLRDVVARHVAEGVTLLDQYAQLCTNHICPDTDNSEAIYDASGHLGGKAQQRIAIWVLNSVNDALRK